LAIAVILAAMAAALLSLAWSLTAAMGSFCLRALSSRPLLSALTSVSPRVV